MRLVISNFAKVKNADIEIKGITVIAGNNNTGKSTVGKSLFAIFNSLHDINEKINDTRRREIISRSRRCVRSSYAQMNSEDNSGTYQGSLLNRKTEMTIREITRLLQSIENGPNIVEDIMDIFLSVSEKNGLRVSDHVVDEFRRSIIEDINLVNGIEDYAISLEIIGEFFGGVFSNQVSNIKNSNPAELALEIHGQTIKSVFSDNRCTGLVSSFEIMHEAFFIDNPFILDELNDWDYVYTDLGIREFLVKKIEQSENVKQESVINTVLAREKLRTVEQIIDKIVPEEIHKDNGEWVVMSDSGSEALRVDNLSAGVKAFLLVKLLLERGVIKEKDVLILDEPEIHLHPEWQIKYAEVIVLLQKMFDLSILVTTHSRDFFEAIDLYSKLHGLAGVCKFYISDESEGAVEFRDVSEDTSEVYRHLVNPSKLLDKLRFDLEDN